MSSWEEFKDFMKYICTVILPGTLVVGVLAYVITMSFIMYDAYSFTKMTGIESSCNLVGCCYVKPHDKWIQYEIWKETEINKTYRVKVQEYADKFQELTAQEYEYLKNIKKSGEKLTADEIKAMYEYEEN